MTTKTAEGTYTTYDNRKFSDYSIVIVTLGYSGADIRASCITAMNEFTAGKNLLVQALHGSTSSSASAYSLSSANVLMVSDTSLKITLGGSKILNSVTVYGIKIK